MFRLAAGSFKDLTRVSDSPAEIWRDICLTNRGSLLEAVNQFENVLAEFKQALIDSDQEKISRFFEQASKIRSTYQRISR